ncbi:MAG TPA: GtrA family protein [Solirubrobacteraceae bacterium]|jgi:putative flippase GtrA|nr:GtrA family protein [Solirubrobacteraceae bacterium]
MGARTRNGERTLRRWGGGSEALAQGVRFGIAGGVVAGVYLGATTLLADVVGLAFQAALAIGFALALTAHFSLQRMFVWAGGEEFVLPLRHQLGRYLLLASLQYGLTAASTALLPSALGLPTETVYLLTVAVVVCVNFLVFRHGIFHAKGTDREHAEEERYTAKPA